MRADAGVGAPFALPVRRALFRPLARLAEWCLGLTTLQRLYARRSGQDFITEALHLLGIEVSSRGGQDGIPANGPVIVIANHPCGALDGLSLIHAIRRRRHDVRVLANHLLLRVPELRKYVIGVDVFSDGRGKTSGVRAARDWLRDGHVLIVFPAGQVSRKREPSGVADGRWCRGVLSLLDWSNAAIVPAFIHAHNRRAFYLAGFIHPLLQTLLLGRELLARRGTRVEVTLGAAVTASRLQELGDASARLAYLRARTYALGQPASPALAHPGFVNAVAAAERPEDLAAEIARLPARAHLLTAGAYDVYCSPAAPMPAILREIGRLRETTFRAVDEGTGHARDVDAFDEHYLHLFVWQRDRREVVAAYRLGVTDRLGAASNPHVLYTRTLFRFGSPLIRELEPAIELGRSFVRAEYQRDSNALLLLWRGIGAFVAREPRYRHLFGAVSISASYRSLTRQLLARVLTTGAFLSHLSALVRPSRPLLLEREAQQFVRSNVVASLDDVDRLVQELEGGRRLPVLLRQYLKLNARLLGFSVDRTFGNVLDGLVLVDLLAVKPALLQRYLGREQAIAFLDYHGSAEVPGFPHEVPSRGSLP
jgi:putative hemolysin